MTPLVDIGVNLTHKSFHADRENVLERARQAGITRQIITGTHLKSSESAAGLAQKYPGMLYSTAGFHPHNAKEFQTDSLQALRELLAQPQVVAVGECGLDFDRDFSPRPVQETCFEAQLALAAETGKPLFLHERKAHQRFSEILSTHAGEYSRAVVHCFTGSETELRKYLDLGCYIGITGWICDERRGRELQNVVKYIPPDRLMLETDAPFLTPRTIHPHPKDGRNEPANLTYVLQTVAECTGKSTAEIAAASTQTAERFFNLPTLPFHG